MRCVLCGRRGHFCCQSTEQLPPQEASCYNCGDHGHLGEECWRVSNLIRVTVLKAGAISDIWAVSAGGCGISKQLLPTSSAIFECNLNNFTCCPPMTKDPL